MANTHFDGDFGGSANERANRERAMAEQSRRRAAFLDALTRKAEHLLEEKKSQITSGHGEEVVAEWNANGFSVVQLPDDEHGVLRISIGGGNETPVIVNYLRFRGNHGKCVDLLRRALRALEDRNE